MALIAPASSMLIASIFLYGALFSRFRLAFGLISLGGVFYLLSQLYWLAAKIQGSLHISLLSKESFRLLFPVQAVSLYLGLATALIGDALLVWQASKIHDLPNT